MLNKINLQKTVDGALELFKYIEVGKLNNHILNENTGGTYKN